MSEQRTQTSQSNTSTTVRRQNATQQRAPEQAPLEHLGHIQRLQRALGNAAVAEMAAAGRLPIQRSMEVGAANDPLEDEADRVAEQVMTMPAPGGVSGEDDEGVMMSRSPVKISRMGGAQDDDEMQLKRLQRKCAACEEESMQMMRVQREAVGEEEDVMMSRVQREIGGEDEDVMMSRCVSCGGAIQRDGGDGSGPVSSSVESSINSVRARGGSPLPESERAFFEPRMGYDFSGVRVHTGPEAQQISRSLNARAFTVGKDVFFGSNEYSPGSSDGRRLMAHELTHTVQQGASGVGRKIRRKPSTAIFNESRSGGAPEGLSMYRDQMLGIMGRATDLYQLALNGATRWRAHWLLHTTAYHIAYENFKDGIQAYYEEQKINDAFYAAILQVVSAGVWGFVGSTAAVAAREILMKTAPAAKLFNSVLSDIVVPTGAAILSETSSQLIDHFSHKKNEPEAMKVEQAIGALPSVYQNLIEVYQIEKPLLEILDAVTLVHRFASHQHQTALRISGQRNLTKPWKQLLKATNNFEQVNKLDSDLGKLEKAIIADSKLLKTPPVINLMALAVSLERDLWVRNWMLNPDVKYQYRTVTQGQSGYFSETRIREYRKPGWAVEKRWEKIGLTNDADVEFGYFTTDGELSKMYQWAASAYKPRRFG